MFFVILFIFYGVRKGIQKEKLSLKFMIMRIFIWHWWAKFSPGSHTMTHKYAPYYPLASPPWPFSQTSLEFSLPHRRTSFGDFLTPNDLSLSISQKHFLGNFLTPSAQYFCIMSVLKCDTRCEKVFLALPSFEQEDTLTNASDKNVENL